MAPSLFRLFACIRLLRAQRDGGLVCYFVNVDGRRLTFARVLAVNSSEVVGKSPKAITTSAANASCAMFRGNVSSMAGKSRNFILAVAAEGGWGNN